MVSYPSLSPSLGKHHDSRCRRECYQLYELFTHGVANLARVCEIIIHLAIFTNLSSLGDLINKLRLNVLTLDPINALWGGGLIPRLRVPWTYAWSEALIPKPKDWGDHISVSGFYFLKQASTYKPPDDLAAFLDGGPPPVYIGFGSITVEDPEKLTSLLFEAIKYCGVRALVSKGWGGLGNESTPDNIFMLGDCPHDWLFPRVSCVVHHGGAGTCAIGIALGKPTVVVPFFGDQPFWGGMVYRAGAGPKPVLFKDMTAETLTESIKFALKPDTLERAKALGEKIRDEDGAANGAKSFHDSLDIDSMRCSIYPDRVAVWRLRRTQLRLSALAATTLVVEGLLEFSHLKL
jgi:hypothetical protein